MVLLWKYLFMLIKKKDEKLTEKIAQKIKLFLKSKQK